MNKLNLFKNNNYYNVLLDKVSNWKQPLPFVESEPIPEPLVLGLYPILLIFYHNILRRSNDHEADWIQLR